MTKLSHPNGCAQAAGSDFYFTTFCLTRDLSSLLRQNFFDQLEYRRQVLVLGSGEIEIFLAFFQAVVGIDVVFWNIDAVGIVRVGTAEFL